MAKTFDVDEFLEREIYPRVPECLDRMLPEFGWTRKGNHWEAANRITTKSVFDARADRVMVYDNNPHWVVVHGAEGRRLLDVVAGCQRPRGDEFWEAVDKMAAAAGVAVPKRSETPAAAAARQERELLEDRMEAFYRWAADELQDDTPKARDARDYLAERGLGVGAIKKLEVGLYADHEAAKRAVEAAGGGWADANRQLTGYLVFPWRDPRGRAATAWCRYVGKPPDNTPKFRGLSGATKPAPLYLDRAARERVREIVLVEGILDAAVAQEMGDPRVVALASTSPNVSDEWLRAMKAAGPDRVMVCLDADKAGDKAVGGVLEKLHAHGIDAWAVPRLPEAVDVDEYLRKHGLAAWQGLVAQSQPGLVRLAEAELREITPEGQTTAKTAAVERVRERVLAMARPGTLAALHVDEVAGLVADRTGMASEAITAVLAKAAEKAAQTRLDAEAKRTAEGLARELKDAKRPRAEILRDYAGRLERLEPVDERPPPLSVDAIVAETRNEPPPVLTGWATLDAEADNDGLEFRGLEFRFCPKELTLVAARPSHGKTAWLMNLAWRWLRSGGGAVLVYSAEEPVGRLFWKLASLASLEIDADRAWTDLELRDWIRGGAYSRRDDYGWPGRQEHVDAILEAMKAHEKRLRIVWNTGWAAADITADAKRWADEFGPPKAVLVDYVQKLASPPTAGKRGMERRDIEITANARELKRLAVELECPVVSGAQVGRQAAEGVTADTRKKLAACATLEAAIEILEAHKPHLHHLREGGMEQEADAVLGLMNYVTDWHATMKHEGVPRADKRSGMKRRTVPIDVGTLKNRYGKVGQWRRMEWTGRYGLVSDAAEAAGPKPYDFD